MDLIDITIILVIAVIMGLTDHFGHKILGLAGKYREKFISFSAGLLIALLLLLLVPDLISAGSVSFLFFFLLLGFIVMHFTEKYIYKHVTNKQELLKDLKKVHIVGFGLDNFLVGFIIATVLELDLILVLNLSIPLFFQMLTSSISLDSMDTQFKGRYSKVILSILPIIGAVLGLILEFEQLITNYVLAFVFGILFYMVIRDVIPTGEKGNSFLFFLGNCVVIILWIIRMMQ